MPCATDPYGNEINPNSLFSDSPVITSQLARSYRYKDWALYAGDSFKLTPSLTINYALRYEHYGVQHNNIQGLDSNFYQGAGTTRKHSRRRSPYRRQKPRGRFWKPRWGTLPPRVGFAYDILGSGTTTLRGGYGISYERNFGNVTYNASFNPPASAVLSDTCNADSGGNIGTNCHYFVTNNDLGPLGLPGAPAPLPRPSSCATTTPTSTWLKRNFGAWHCSANSRGNTIREIYYSGAQRPPV